jgi:hypothetical protein
MNPEISIAAIYFLCFKLCLILTEKYSKLSYRDNVHIASKITSWINAGLAVSSSCTYLLDNTKTQQLANYLVVMRGYTVFDSINVSYYNKYFDCSSTLLHHLSLFALTFADMKIKNFPYYAARGLMGEATNFPLYLGWYLIKIKKSNCKIFKINAFILLILWFLVRASNYTHLSWSLFKDINPGKIEKITMFIISCLNNYWFFKLCSKANQMKSKKNITFKPEEENW